MKKHEKHAKLAKPDIGNFGRNELALVGAPCSEIQRLAGQLIEAIGVPNTAYIDADHAFGDSETGGLCRNELTDKIKFFRFDKQHLNDFDRKILLNDQQFIFINGNHFQGKKQLVLIHPQKEESLKKRLGQLTDCIGFVLCEGLSGPFDWLGDLMADKPVFDYAEIDKISALIKNTFTPPPIKGLVLAGGRSTRMGEDKGQLRYHGLSQVDYLLAEFEKSGIEAFISCRADQYENRQRITDKFEGLGPFGAIVSGFQSDPDVAWLVVACDLPLVNAGVFEELIHQRNPARLATAFHNTETGFVDPLITLWEPRAYMRLMEFLAMGYSCPRKVLINSDVEVIQPSDPLFLRNVNTPQDKASFLF